MIDELVIKKEELQSELQILLDEIKILRQKNERVKDIEAEIFQIKNKISRESRLTKIGKCFKVINKKYDGIEAFKILDILAEPNVDYALCLCIGEGDNTTSVFTNYAKSIKTMVLPLWLPINLRLMSNNNDKKVIDEYGEITQEEFSDLLNKMYKTLTMQ